VILYMFLYAVFMYLSSVFIYSSIHQCCSSMLLPQCLFGLRDCLVYLMYMGTSFMPPLSPRKSPTQPNSSMIPCICDARRPCKYNPSFPQRILQHLAKHRPRNDPTCHRQRSLARLESAVRLFRERYDHVMDVSCEGIDTGLDDPKTERVRRGLRTC
jgi:hypothetical protein